ncbi:glycosyltransferase family 2 protein [bacterium]|nr:glycosyltransferase family 2 protein [bacterium]
MSDNQHVCVIIPHYNGEALLRRCLFSLMRTGYPHYSVCVVDNGSTDGSMAMVRREFPRVRILSSDINLGYAGGCNYGIRHTDAPFVALLNNDAEVTAGWLAPLVRMLGSDSRIAAVQPKILSLQNPGMFDYAGAAGGEMDIFGYPFARGRLFHVMEEDTGQYDASGDVFWASGAACVLKRQALDRVGSLETSFFAHMEEIDLCWRLHAAGYRVCVATEAVVYHRSGGTLGQERIAKMILNHRNSIIMVLRNYSAITLAWILPVRLLLELMTCIAGLLTGQWKRALAVPVALAGVIRRLGTVISGRRSLSRIRSVTDRQCMKRMFRGSVAVSFFLLGRRTCRDISATRERVQP